MSKKQIKYLYKYKQIVTAFDLTIVLDIINNRRIYLPRYEQLNDPFESYMNDIYSAEMGNSILQNIGIRKEHINDRFNKYGILSLTSNCRNQVMWTMYANYYKGICIGF